MAKTITRLPDAELSVMQALWRCEPPAGRDALEVILSTTHPMAPTTLLTLLTRLENRGFLSVEKVGRRSVYTPLVSQADYLASQSKTFVEKLFGGSMSAFASALCHSGLSREELQELRRLLEEGEL